MERVRCDLVSSELPSETVVRAVSEATGAHPTDLRPLYEVLDPDALDSMLAGRQTGRVQFEYAGHEVSVDEEGVVVLDAV